MPEKFYVTTPIYYVNDKPHIGHAYTTIAADVLARWHRLCGDDVHFLTGTDEHGQKVLEASRKRGLTPQEHVDHMVVPFRELWARLDITHDDFIRTTEERHKAVVRGVLDKLHAQGDLYTADYEGWYSPAVERFWTEKDLVDGKCPESGLPVEWVREKNWFFKMSRYEEPLRRWIDQHPRFLRPDSRRNEVLGALKGGLGDLCISRIKTRLPWGIEFPFDADYVTYVWVDALLNYISALGYPDLNGAMAFWPAQVQLVGKDILTTHAVYWSTMLLALGLEPAHCLFAHGWWTVEGRKMGKSFGNAIDPHLLIDAYGPDAVRYHLLREIPFGGDGDFSHQGFLTRYNADLANDLGNLAHRALSMTEKWLGARVPALDTPNDGDRALLAVAAKSVADFRAEMADVQFHKALEALWTLVKAGNKYIDTEGPWKLQREGQTVRLQGVLRRCLEIVDVAAVLLSSVCPNKAEVLRQKLAAEPFAVAPSLGQLDRLVTGRPVHAGEPLFPRLLELPVAVADVLAQARAAEENQAMSTPTVPPSPAAAPPGSVPTPATPAAAPPAAPAVVAEAPALIGIEDFAKVQLRSGKVLDAKTHPNADKLLVLTVDIGEASPRTIVAGIASKFKPEQVVGRTVVVVANLKPVKLRGIESQGMLLAAGGGQVVDLVALGAEVAPGTVVR